MATDKERLRADIARRLNEMVRARGNASEIARQAGVPRVSLQQWITGKRSPSAENVSKLCRAMKISSDWLLGVS